MKNSQRKPVLLIALGGNALLKKGEEGTAQQQLENLKTPIRQIAGLSRDYSIIITHGNGPQIGNLLLQQESCKLVPEMPLEILVAQTQGQIGYMIESILDSELMALGISDKPLVSVLSYVVVDENDPAFQTPSKPIGPVYSQEEAAAAEYPVSKTAKGYRRVVVSPKPVTIIEKREIKKLIEMDFIVICCGGGGIPVVREERAFCGIGVVIDKDLASARLAKEVGVDIFIIATDVNGVALNYGRENQEFLKSLTLKEAEQLLAEGHFPPGTMQPKIEAVLQFINQGGKRAVITSIENIEDSVLRKAGTEFIPSPIR